MTENFDMRKKLNIMIRDLNKLRKYHNNKYNMEYIRKPIIKVDHKQYSKKYYQKIRDNKDRCIYCLAMVDKSYKDKHLKRKVCLRFQQLYKK